MKFLLLHFFPFEQVDFHGISQLSGFLLKLLNLEFQVENIASIGDFWCCRRSDALFGFPVIKQVASLYLIVAVDGLTKHGGAGR